jgi:hypothetical protein
MHFPQGPAGGEGRRIAALGANVVLPCTLQFSSIDLVSSQLSSLEGWRLFQARRSIEDAMSTPMTLAPAGAQCDRVRAYSTSHSS